MKLKFLLEGKSIKYNHNHLNTHHGQDDFTINAVSNGEIIGRLDYTVFNDFATISMIEVDKEHRGNKIGFNLIKELAKKIPYTKIIRGNLTDDGNKLYKSTEKYFEPYIKKGKDEWGKNLNFKKYFEDSITDYSKKEIEDILNSWNETIEIETEYFENIDNIVTLLKKYKIDYNKTESSIIITVNTKLGDVLELFKQDFPGIKPNLLNDYGDFLEDVYNKLKD